jgi:PKHD-type hydroxylase
VTLQAPGYGPTRIHWDHPDAFSEAECDRIVALAETIGLQPALVHGEQGAGSSPAVRDVATSFHPRGDATSWLYDRIDALFSEAAVSLGVEIGPMREDLQILRYRPGSHFQMWHSDAGYDRKGDRILSASLELSDAGDYDGGDLEILPNLFGRTRPPRRGAIRIFRSQGLHRVTPVVRGVRWALVNWTGAGRL